MDTVIVYIITVIVYIKNDDIYKEISEDVKTV